MSWLKSLQSLSLSLSLSQNPSQNLNLSQNPSQNPSLNLNLNLNLSQNLSQNPNRSNRAPSRSLSQRHLSPLGHLCTLSERIPNGALHLHHRPTRQHVHVWRHRDMPTRLKVV